MTTGDEKRRAHPLPDRAGKEDVRNDRGAGDNDGRGGEFRPTCFASGDGVLVCREGDGTEKSESDDKGGMYVQGGVPPHSAYSTWRSTTTLYATCTTEEPSSRRILWCVATNGPLCSFVQTKASVATKENKKNKRSSPLSIMLKKGRREFVFSDFLQKKTRSLRP